VWWAWFLDDDHGPADTTFECLACSATVTDLRAIACRWLLAGRRGRGV
jgi:hypothetical protein